MLIHIVTTPTIAKMLARALLTRLENLPEPIHWWRARFESMEKTAEQIQSILNRNSNMTLIGEDKRFIEWILSHTKDWKEVASEVCHLNVVIGPRKQGHKIIGINAQGDQVTMPLSWKEAFMSPEALAVYRCNKALRSEINDQTDAFRQALTQPIVCGECRKMINTADPYELEIDHVVFFNDLVRDWQHLEHLDHRTIKIERRDKYLRLADLDLAQRWSMYHKQNARLQPTHKACNASRPKPPKKQTKDFFLMTH